MRLRKSYLFGLLCLTAILTLRAFCQNPDTLTILHTSDPHILYNVDEFNPVIAEVHKVHRYSADSLSLFFRTVPKLVRADAVVITGDLIDIFEGETKSNGFFASEIGQFRYLYDECPVPLYLTLGNHDVTSYSVNDAKHAIVESQTCAERARASWIRNIPCFYNGTYYARTFPVGHTKYHFIFLDNGYSLHDGGRVIDKVQYDWLKEQVSEAGDEPVVLFFHIYFSVGDVNGDGIYFKQNGPVDWPTEKQCSEGLLKIVNEHGNIKAMVVGHGHSDIYEPIHFPGGHTVYQIETGSVTEDHSGWRLFQFTENGIVVSRQGSRTAEIKIDLHAKGE
jgi:3',5'-cyclic AMP phosphodiesterase CpdA